MANAKNTNTKNSTKTSAHRTPPEGELFSGARWTDVAGASRIVTDPKEIEEIIKRNPEIFGRR